jgi:hypothetical protein
MTYADGNIYEGPFYDYWGEEYGCLTSPDGEVFWGVFCFSKKNKWV